ncbi:MAG: site-specific integrase [Peptococcaceae bacterium]|nr:site-specific integrase [Peptococcaceae bacterium]
MRGHIRNRGTKSKPNWAYVVDTGYDAEGKRIRPWVSGFSTEEEAEDALARALADIQNGNPLAKNKPKRESVFGKKEGQQTVAEYLRGWLQHKELRDTSHYDYNYLIEHHIIPGIGDILLVNLDGGRIKEMYDGIKAYSLSVRQKVDGLLRSALEVAVKDKILLSNPCFKDLRPRKESKWSSQKISYGIDEVDSLDLAFDLDDMDDLEPFRAMNDEQLARFIDVIIGTRFYAAHLLTVRRGLRRGEVLGLRVRDMDFKRHTLLIRRSLVVCNGKRVFHPPKTERSRRTIILTSELEIVLEEHLGKQREEKMKRRDTYKDIDMVFATQDGYPYQPNLFVKRHFKPLLVKAGLPDFRYHDLRHTAASMMLKDDVGIQVTSEVLGHSSEAFTFKVYGHLLPSMQKMALARSDKKN